MKCPQCGHQNAKHYKFCLDCGAEIPSVATASSGSVPVKSKRVGIADAFDSAPIKNPSPATLIRQVEDLSSDIGLGNPLSSPITAPPVGDLKSGLQNPLLSEKKPESSMLSSPLVASIQAGESPKRSGSLLKEEPTSESEEINFHTSLSSGRDSLASFEGEFFGELEAARALEASDASVEESDPPPVPSPEESLSDPALAALNSIGSISQEAPSKALNCTSCQAEIPKDFLFCGRCGTKVEQVPVEVQSQKEAVAIEPVIEETPVVGILPLSQQPQASSVTPLPQSLGIKADALSRLDQIHSKEEQINEDEGHSEEQSNRAIELVHIHLDGSEGESIHIDQQGYILGKTHDWEVFNTDEYLSDQHAQIEFSDDGEILLKDLGGVNGVFLRLTRPTPLAHSDYFRAGQQLFAFEKLSPMSSLDQTGTKKLGSPQYEAWGRLVHVIGQGEVGRAWLLHNDEILLGRVKGEIIFDQDRFMSGLHCTVSLENGQAWLKDNGSTNGSFIRIREQIVLEDEDLILLGQKIFKVKFS